MKNFGSVSAKKSHSGEKSSELSHPNQTSKVTPWKIQLIQHIGLCAEITLIVTALFAFSEAYRVNQSGWDTIDSSMQDRILFMTLVNPIALVFLNFLPVLSMIAYCLYHIKKNGIIIPLLVLIGVETFLIVQSPRWMSDAEKKIETIHPALDHNNETVPDYAHGQAAKNVFQTLNTIIVICLFVHILLLIIALFQCFVGPMQIARITSEPGKVLSKNAFLKDRPQAKSIMKEPKGECKRVKVKSFVVSNQLKTKSLAYQIPNKSQDKQLAKSFVQRTKIDQQTSKIVEDKELTKTWKS